ncbi:MAG TPA: helix-turn-helix domain-containing protein [Caldilineaceae bacterium]|nr:helix-turn-helix domain-containing protein [Caldilineaceae bacterium]
MEHLAERRPLPRLHSPRPTLEDFLCPVDEAARIIGQKWTLQIVHHLLDRPTCRFCELQEALGGVNPSTLSSRLKMLEEEGLVHRVQVSAVPPHVEYSLTEKGEELRDVIAAITRWSNTWLCGNSNGGCQPATAPTSLCLDQ